MRNTLLLLSLVLSAAAAASAAETTIRLKNGRVLTGTIVSDQGNFITFESDGKQLKILRSIVETIDGEQSRSPAGQDAAPASRPLPSARDAFANFSRKKTTPRPEPSATDTAPKAEAASDRQRDTVPTDPGPHPAAEAEPPNPPPAPPPRQPSPPKASADTDEVKTEPAGPPATSTADAKPKPTQDRAPSPVPVDTKSPAPADTLRTNTSPPRVASRRGESPHEPAVLPLVEIGRLPGHLQPLVEMLDQGNPVEQIAAALKLAQLGTAAAPAVPYLIRRFRSTEVVTRVGRRGNSDIEGLSPSLAATRALVAVGEPAVGNLSRAMHHNEAAMRVGAARTLGRIKVASGANPLIAALQDPDDDVRAAVAVALGAIRDPRTIPMLITLMNEDESTVVQAAAMAALQNLTEVPLLIEGLRDSASMVRENAAYILFLMTAKEFGTDVAAWEQWWQQEHQTRAPAPKE